MNEKGQVVNVLPIVHKQNKGKKIEWQCGFLCKDNEASLINRFKQFLISVSNCLAIRNIPRLIKSIGICTVKQSNKLGHSQACYINDKLCKSKSILTQVIESLIFIQNPSDTIFVLSLKNLSVLIQVVVFNFNKFQWNI
jgi:hypothetical protein